MYWSELWAKYQVISEVVHIILIIALIVFLAGWVGYLYFIDWFKKRNKKGF